MRLVLFLAALLGGCAYESNVRLSDAGRVDAARDSGRDLLDAGRVDGSPNPTDSGQTVDATSSGDAGPMPDAYIADVYLGDGGPPRDCLREGSFCSLGFRCTSGEDVGRCEPFGPDSRSERDQSTVSIMGSGPAAGVTETLFATQETARCTGGQQVRLIAAGAIGRGVTDYNYCMHQEESLTEASYEDLTSAPAYVIISEGIDPAASRLRLELGAAVEFPGPFVECTSTREDSARFTLRTATGWAEAVGGYVDMFRVPLAGDRESVWVGTGVALVQDGPYSYVVQIDFRSGPAFYWC